MTQRTGPAKDNSAAVAARFGITLKALRHYERLGLLKPPRTRAGWRVYGQAEYDRLHVVLSLKQIGLPLSRIAALLKSGKTDLHTLLSLQEEALLRTRCEVEHALTLLRIARERLRDRQTLSGDELAEMVRRISATVMRWTPEIDALAKRSLNADQIAHVRPSRSDAAKASELSGAWEQILSALNGLGLDPDPSSDAALAIGRRMIALFRAASGSDKDVWNSNARFWQAAAQDSQVMNRLNIDPAHFALVGKVLGELKRRGELRF